MKKIASLFLTVIMTVILCSCGGADDSEILTALDELAPKAHEIYEIVYGDALPHGEIGDDGYARISDEAKYTTVAELEEAMFEIFTPEYVQVMSNTAFSGVSSDQGSINAKFIEKNGHLYVDPSVTEDFGVMREFDLTDAYVTKKNKYMAIVHISHEDGDIEVTLQYADEVWRIDSPLF